MNLNQAAEVLNLSFDTRHKQTIDRFVKEAKESLSSKGEWRFKVADLAIRLHEEIFGENTRWNIQEARILRSIFARDIGQSLRTVENWMEVKTLIVDELPPAKTQNLPYVDLVDTLYLLKNKKLTAKQALDRHLSKRINPQAHRMMLIERYSSNLLTSLRKFDIKGASDEEIILIKDRLEECLQRLEK